MGQIEGFNLAGHFRLEVRLLTWIAQPTPRQTAEQHERNADRGTLSHRQSDAAAEGADDGLDERACRAKSQSHREQDRKFTQQTR